MQALGSIIFQATIAIRLVTTSNHARGKDPDPGSGSENPDLYLKLTMIAIPTFPCFLWSLKII